MLYDSALQARVAERDPQIARRQYLAQLRLDGFFNEQVVLTDSQLLDGAFFCGVAQNGPDGIVHGLPTGKLRIAARADSLAECLRQMIVADDQDMLKPFVFSTLPRPLRYQVATELALMPATSIRGWRDIPRALTQAGASDDQARQMAEVWTSWFELEASHRVELQPRNPSVTVDAHFNRAELADLQTREGRELRDLALALRRNKSEFERRLLERRSQALTADVSSEYLMVESWYWQNYNRALCDSYACDAFEFVEEESVKSFGATRRIFDLVRQGEPSVVEPRLVVSIPSGLASRLANLPNYEYLRLIHDNEPLLRSWWFDGNRDALRAALENVNRELLSPGPSSGLLQLGVTSALAGAGASVGYVLAEEFGQGPQGAAAGAAAGAVVSAAIHASAETLVATRRRRIVEHTTRHAEWTRLSEARGTERRMH